MSESNRVPKERKPVQTRYFQGRLACERCTNVSEVRDFNEHHKVYSCGVCGFKNDLTNAKKAAA